MDKAAVNSIISFFKESVIANGVSVDGIALFGSALAGNMRDDSDLDVIVISKSFEGKDIFERAKMTAKPEIEAIRKFKIPLDVLTMSPKEYENSQQARFYKSQIVA